MNELLRSGMPVVTSLYMTESQEVMVWEPCGRSGWKQQVRRVVQVPRRDALVVGGEIIIHPAMLPALRAALSDGKCICHLGSVCGAPCAEGRHHSGCPHAK